MPKEIITSLIGAFTAILPLIINYFSKKSKDNAFKNLLDASQTRINFINNYYDALHRLLPDAELEALKSKLAAELYVVKQKVTELEEAHVHTGFGWHNTFQKIFLTYKPLTFMGWIWAILFYLNLSILSIVLMGMAIDEKNNFSGTQFLLSIKEDGSLSLIIFLIATLLLIRWLALRNYKRHSYRQIATAAVSSTINAQS